MSLSPVDYLVFLAFLVLVVGVSLYASRHEKNSEDYFLAGRGLSWWLIGMSLIASNISTEQFVGMAGAGFGSMGLAVASYEWVAAITLVFVALVLLPRFLRAGLYTIPEYLEYRYSRTARTVMSVYMLAMYAFVALASILYSGALGIQAIFGFDLTLSVWALGALAAGYTIYGGLKAVVWSDLIQGVALLLGGLLCFVLGLQAVGGWSNFVSTHADKLHMMLPADHPEIPWTAMLFGIWVPNLFYWGLNQFITQRTLGARSLAHGQHGILFAALIKLTIPFIIVIPGIMAVSLYGSEIASPDQAYPVLVTHLLPAGLRGFMLAALFGAVMSSLDSLLNSASTIYTMDLHARYVRPDLSQRELVRVGRIATAVLVVAGCAMAPALADPRLGGIFRYIQMFQGFVSPGIVTVFLFGIAVSRVPASAAVGAMLLNPVVYGLLLWALPQVAFLNHMAITVTALTIFMAMLTAARPAAPPASLPASGPVDLEPSRYAPFAGAAIVLLTVALYVVFW